jgi:hypothetical protein
MRKKHWTLRLTTACALVAIGTCGWFRDASAAQVQSGVGYDYQSGPNGQNWRGALGFVSCAPLGSELTVAAVRYEDSNVGPGFSGFANAGVPVLSGTRLRVVGVRAVGDGSYRSYRVRFGPELPVMGRGTVGVFFSHFEDNEHSRLNAFGSEVGVSIARPLAGTGGISYGTWETGLASFQANAGLVWAPAGKIQILGDVSLGRNVLTVAGTSPGGGGRLGRLPVVGDLVGGGGRGTTTTTQEDKVGATGTVGFRILIP